MQNNRKCNDSTYCFSPNLYLNFNLLFKSRSAHQANLNCAECRLQGNIKQGGRKCQLSGTWDMSLGSAVSSEYEKRHQTGVFFISCSHTAVNCAFCRVRDQRPWKRWTVAWRGTSCGWGRRNERRFTLLWSVMSSGKELTAFCRSVWSSSALKLPQVKKVNQLTQKNPFDQCITCMFWFEWEVRFKHCRKRFYCPIPSPQRWVSIAVLWLRLGPVLRQDISAGGRRGES